MTFGIQAFFADAATTIELGDASGQEEVPNVTCSTNSTCANKTSHPSISRGAGGGLMIGFASHVGHVLSSKRASKSKETPNRLCISKASARVCR